MTNTATGIITGVVIVVLILIGWAVFWRDTGEVEVDQDINVIRTTPTMTALPTATSTPTAATSPSLTPTGSPAAGAVKSFTVAASNFAFSPAQLRVKQGDTVRLTLTNGSTMPHDWRLDDFQAATKVITQGQSDTVEFVASKKGTFEYYCSVGTHRQQGMVGQLIVE